MADLIELYLLGELGFLPLFFLYFDLADLGFDFDLPDLDGLTGLSESPELTFFGLHAYLILSWQIPSCLIYSF